MKGVGIEACIILSILLEEKSHYVSEPDIPYADLSRIEVLEARMLMALVKNITARLERLGARHVRLKPEKILITKDMRILIPSRNNIEIHLQPLPKALFLLYLLHPEGLAFKEIPSHAEELLQLYMNITPRTDRDAIKDSIRKMLEPGRNTISVNCSRLTVTLERYFENPVLQDYLIKGLQGEPRQIALNRSLVTWEGTVPFMKDGHPCL